MRYVRIVLGPEKADIVKVPDEVSQEDVFAFFEGKGVLRENIELLNDKEGRAAEVEYILTNLPTIEDLMAKGKYVCMYSYN